jgi:uncharacterized membrane protein
MWPGYWHMGEGWGFWWLLPLGMMTFFVLCGFLFMSYRHEGQAASAIRLLNERFAKGEISKEEFEEKRTILVRQP